MDTNQDQISAPLKFDFATYQMPLEHHRAEGRQILSISVYDKRRRETIAIGVSTDYK
jgi:hypothetical protein